MNRQREHNLHLKKTTILAEERKWRSASGQRKISTVRLL
jgi:hypothetical protein